MVPRGVLTMDSKTVLYTIGCPRCNILERKLDEKKIAYEVCDDMELMLSKGFKTAPVLEVDGVAYNFSEAIRYVNNYVMGD